MQGHLFGEEPIQSSINGLVYQEGFLSTQEARKLIDVIRTLPLHAARYKQYLARRRVASGGRSYNFDANRLLPGIPLDRSAVGLAAQRGADY